MQGNSDVRTFLPALIDRFQQGQLPVDRLVTHYDHATAPDPTSLGAGIELAQDLARYAL